MHKSESNYSFTIDNQEGHTVITAQQWPWSVFQVVPCTPATFDKTVETCKKECGAVATHGTNRTFVIINLTSGDQGGKYPERHIVIDGQSSARHYLDILYDQMAQAASWYYSNILNCGIR